MKNIWLKKIFVVLVSIMTLGMYVPPVQLHTNTEASNKEIESSKDDSLVDNGSVFIDETTEIVDAFIPDTDPISSLTEQAKAQAFLKLGPKISNRIEANFTSEILPGIEEVVATILQDVGSDEVPYIKVSEAQYAGYGEKIFDLYDERTKQDIARFHVRRDNRPQEGYWFNFHYHTEQDGYETHHTIGEVYWSKDTPPKWMA
ncbi:MULTISPECIES: YpjP family protein [Paraliobacillus]|uniref:YpjP family protein n=1 Tax=Paraliobacillus TaxID=200903 RepID=UPI000DD491EE|nr:MULTISPECIES: YpjP family protein [Paraliobacillus]